MSRQEALDMSSPASPHSVPEPVELVIAEDGSVPAAQLARLGLRPGTHLRVVAAPARESQRTRRLEGALVGKVNGAALVAALGEVKASRTAAIDRDLT